MPSRHRVRLPVFCLLSYVFFVIRHEVADTENVNVALNKPTNQSSLYCREDYGLLFCYKSKFAVDGGHGTDFNVPGFCAHTLANDMTWWMVDLLASYQINTIVITNRNTFYDRLKNFKVYVSNTFPQTLSKFAQGDLTYDDEVCLSHLDPVPAGGPHTYPCGKVIAGRYVILVKYDHTSLTICEFEARADSSSLLGVKQNIFTVFKGFKGFNVQPFSVTTAKNKLNCVSACMAAYSDGIANIVQFEEATSMCQCIQGSRLTGAYGRSESLGWVLMVAKNN